MCPEIIFRTHLNHLVANSINFCLHAANDQLIYLCSCVYIMYIVCLLQAFHLERECAKLTLATGSTIDAWTTMASCIVDYTTHVNASINSSINLEEIGPISNYTARSLLNMVKWFQTDYRSAIAHVKQARASDVTDKSPLANSLSVLLDMEHDGVMQRLGLAACGDGESAEGG